MGAVSDLINAGFGGYQGWGEREAEADFKATGGRGKETRGGGDGGGQNISSPGVIPGAVMSFKELNQLQRDALEILRPYYERILSESRGDVTLAKRRLEDDYKLGRRYREEEQQVATRGFEMVEPREREELLTAMNRRGLLASTIRTQEESQLTTQQQRRREAIQRALGRKEEIAGIERARTLEDISIQQPRFEKELARRKRGEAFEYANISAQMGEKTRAAERLRFLREDIGGEPFNR